MNNVAKNNFSFIVNIMDKTIKIYDNGGKTWDRYTVLTEPFYSGKSCNSFGFSENAKSPQGFNQYTGDVFMGAKLGKEIDFNKLPKEVKGAIKERLKNNN